MKNKKDLIYLLKNQKTIEDHFLDESMFFQ